MSKVSEPQKIRLGPKHSRFAKASPLVQNSDGYVTFAVGDRYKILEAIGTGAYGVVCSAIDSKTKQHVAIKKIVNPFEVLTTAKRTLRELKLLLHFKHDNVVGIRNIIQSKQKHPADVYLVMDLMESDLHHIIRSEQPLTPEHVCYFLYQLLRGLKYIHSANVIHRDLKPSNLLVNENCELKIGDFGMARGVSSTPEDHKMFMTEYVATRWYRAPELMLSIGEYSQAIDMWSVGCIFAEMMGRKQIFPGRHYVHQLQLVISVLGSPANELVKSIRSERVRSYVISLPRKEPVKFKSLYPKASERMLELLQSFLQFDPQKRPSAEQALTHSFFSGYHDVDDEPLCPHPFDFRFESTVTKTDVCNQVSSVIDGYQDRKNRLSKQLIIVSNEACDVATDGAKLLSQSNDNECSTAADITSLSTGLVKENVSVFKKPSLPYQPQKVHLSKANDQPSLKPLNDDVDMKSATSVCSMDFNVVDLTGGQDSQLAISDVPLLSTHKDVCVKKTLPKSVTASKPLITVQVVRDGVVDLTGDDDDENAQMKTKKPIIKQKKEPRTEKPAPKKKTTISEDTKMKIRDAIFSNKLAKQKGLGTPLEKVKKTVTAAERQREREEKRKKRQKRAEEKAKQNEDEARKKNPLSEADRSSLDRWKKMQENVSQEDVGNQNLESSRSEVARSKSNRIQVDGKPAKKNDIIRRQSFPLSTNRSYPRTSNVPENVVSTSTKSFNQTNNKIITVLFNGEGTHPSSAANNTTNLNLADKTSTDTVLANCPRTMGSNPVNSSVTMNYTTGFSTISYTPQNHYTVAFVQNEADKSETFASNVDPNLTSHFSNNKLREIAPNPNVGSSLDKFIATGGGVFVPEDNSRDSKDIENDSVRNRPTMLFGVNDDPKVLVDNQLLTPGKALQKSNLLSTPKGQNLATLSPDTIDFVLNDDFQQQSTNLPSQEVARSHHRPASYPSLNSADLEALNSLSNPFQVAESTHYRSQSFTHAPESRSAQDGAVESHDRARATSCNVTTNNIAPVLFTQDDPQIDKKLNSDSSFEFSPASFLKSLDEHICYTTTASDIPQANQPNGGVFVPNLGNPMLSQPRASSVMMSDALPSAGAASAVGYGLGVDISDIIPSSAGDAASSMEYGTDQSDSALLANWLDVSCLCPQDMEALQRELELGSPMSIDGT